MQSFQTSVRKRTYAPVWDETLQMESIESDNLRIVIKDWNRWQARATACVCVCVCIGLVPL